MRLMLTLTLTTIAALTVVGCDLLANSATSDDAPTNSTSEPATGTPDPAEPGLELGGVDLNGNISVLGTEPFWAVGFEGDQMVYSGLDRPEQHAPRTEPAVGDGRARWVAQTDAGQDLVVLLTEEECSDGMSDRTYPLKAEVTIAGEELVGCAAATEWLHSTDETGAPREGEG